MSFKVLFLYPNFRTESIIPPAITLLSRILKNAGMQTAVFDTTDYGLNLSKDYDRDQEKVLSVRPVGRRKPKYEGRDALKDLNECINSFSPDLLAMSVTESTALLGFDMLKNIRHRDIPVVVGGVFPTFAPMRTFDFLSAGDMVCIGEGEYPLLELCERMRKGEDYTQVKGIWIKERDGSVRRNQQPPLVDLDQNPTDFDLGLFPPERLRRPMADEHYQMTPVETMRGCPYRCTFCNSPGQNEMFDTQGSRFVRHKSMTKVREEMLNYKQNFGAEYIYLWADTFLAMPKKMLAEFCEIYQDIKLPFWMQTRVETVSREKLVMLKEVGLHRISFGIENGDEQFRQKVLVKEFSNDEAVEKLAIAADLGIPYSTNNMVGYPHETREIAMETVRLNRRFPRPDNTSCAVFTPYYGTVARDVAVKAGFMPADMIAPGITEDSVLDMPQFPAAEIKKVRRVFALYVGLPESRWGEIRAAEEETPEGDALLASLQAEYKAKYFGTGNTATSQY